MRLDRALRGSATLVRQRLTQPRRENLVIGIAIRVCQAGHRVQFGAASAWVAHRAEAHHAGHLQLDLVRLGRHRLLVVASAASATNAEDAGFDLARQRPFDVTGELRHPAEVIVVRGQLGGSASRRVDGATGGGGTIATAEDADALARIPVTFSTKG